MISFAMFDDVATFWRHFGSYFQVLLGYAHVGVVHVVEMVDRRVKRCCPRSLGLHSASFLFPNKLQLE